MRTRIRVIGATVAVAAAAGGVGYAWAASDDEGTTEPSEPAAAPDAPATTEPPPPEPGQREREERASGEGGRLAAIALPAAADAIGITPEELEREMSAGRTIAAVAGEHGVETSVVTDAAVMAVTARLDEAVASGRLDAARADALRPRLPALVARLVEGDPATSA